MPDHNPSYTALNWLMDHPTKIRHPTKGLIRLTVYWYQAAYLRSRAHFSLINKARQTGWSTAVAGRMAYRVTHWEGYFGVVVSKNEAAALNLARYIKDILQNSSDPALHSEMRIVYKRLQIVIYKNLKTPDGKQVYDRKGRPEEYIFGEVHVLPANESAGRSYSATEIALDEFAHAQFADEIYQGVKPTVSHGGYMTVLSTPPLSRGHLFQTLWIDKDNDFERYEVHWYDCPQYNSKYHIKDPKARKAEGMTQPWYKANRGGYSPKMWAIEFECSFDSGTDIVFTKEEMEAMFIPNYMSETNFEREDIEGQLWLDYKSLDRGKPKPGHYYAHGVDLGRKQDPTVIVIYDITLQPARLVAFAYIEPGSGWEAIIATIRQILTHFNSQGFVDTTGLGDVIYEQIEDLTDGYTITEGVNSQRKYNLIENTRRAASEKVIQLPEIDVLYKQHSVYAWSDKKLKQDCVIANCLAVHQFYEAGALQSDPNYSILR